MDAPPTVFVLGVGGSIFEMDVPPAATMTREAWDERVAKGELTIIPAAAWVDRGDGSRYLVAVDPDAKPKRQRSTPARTAATQKELVEALKELGVEIDPAWSSAADLAGALEWTLATIDEDPDGDGDASTVGD